MPHYSLITNAFMDANIQVVLTCSLQIINKKLLKPIRTLQAGRRHGRDSSGYGRPGTPKLADSANNRASREEGRAEPEALEGEVNGKQSSSSGGRSKNHPAKRQTERPHNPIIPFIEGDGIGVDVTPAMLKVVDAAVEKAYKGERKISGWKFTPVRNQPMSMAGRLAAS